MEMVMRSAQRELDLVEFMELQRALQGFGCYEVGMPVEEMRELMNALQESEASFINSEETKESVLANSTMIGSLPIKTDQAPEEGFSSDSLPSFKSEHNACNFDRVDYNCNTAASESPLTPVRHFTFAAEVHHPFDWSPTTRTRQDSGDGTANSTYNVSDAPNNNNNNHADGDNNSSNEDDRSRPKRPPRHQQHLHRDSGINSCSEPSHQSSGSGMSSVHTASSTDFTSSDENSFARQDSGQSAEGQPQASSSSVAVSTDASHSPSSSEGSFFSL